MLSFVRRHLPEELVYLAYLGVFGVLVVGFGAFVLVRAVTVAPLTAPHVAKVHSVAFPGLESGQTAASNPDGANLDQGSSTDSQSTRTDQDLSQQANLEPVPAAPAPAERPNRPVARPTPRFGETAPLPPARPAEIDSPENPLVPLPPKHTGLALAYAAPESSVAGEPRTNPFGPSSRYDQFTAVYDLTRHTVYLPNGMRLEAHSGLGELLDDPHHVNEIDRGATPPHVYELTPREASFHGVQALRLNPVGGGDIFGRTGLLAHPYMLGPNGDSNGCVSFKDYDVFLQAFQNGQVKRLAVVARLD